ncbi:guanitoxin biosynthesis L-enduracididine beta-hydroxylase GntD [Peterkaempfera sp. SMS 1(5)a]|uniref:guanitoxin biosynthesis L-enduracididine beta-hydroxylase GntD n=1 Tax=Peterkaempfera podocarpi TaxID=3232308 RepID=UPI00366BB012
MYRHSLSTTESDQIDGLLDELTQRYHSVEDPELLRELPVVAHRLPLGLRRFLADFRLIEPAPVCVVSGHHVSQQTIGATPEHWSQRSGVSPALREELYLMLCSAVLGDPFGWATQQDGYLVHDVLPIKGHEQEQIGTGSEQTIWWHVEDAFHPYRGDYVGLLCLRNPDQVPTTFAGIADLEISDRDREVLAQARYEILPDNSHLQMLDSGPGRALPGASELLDRAYQRIKEMRESPTPVPVLFGAPHDPYLCLDPYFMDLERLAQSDPEASAALRRFCDEVDAKLTGAALAPGDVLFVDNYRAVHGRQAFKARFDGTDRWLKRVNVVRDLRRSRDARHRAESRILF